jgi:hypothetical protein
MGLSNAERQKRHRERVKEKLQRAERAAPIGGLRPLPAIIADLPQETGLPGYDGDQSPASIARQHLDEMLPVALDLINSLSDYRGLAQEAGEVLGVDPDPLRGLTYRQLKQAIQAAKLRKEPLKKLLGKGWERHVRLIEQEERTIFLEEAYQLRPLAEHLGLWHEPPPHVATKSGDELRELLIGQFRAAGRDLLEDQGYDDPESLREFEAMPLTVLDMVEIMRKAGQEAAVKIYERRTRARMGLPEILAVPGAISGIRESDT